MTNQPLPKTNDAAAAADVDALLDHLTLESDAPADLRRRVAADQDAARDLDELRAVATRLAELPADWPDVTETVLSRAGFVRRRPSLVARLGPALLPLAATAVLALAAAPLLVSALRGGTDAAETNRFAGRPLLASNNGFAHGAAVETAPQAIAQGPIAELAGSLPPIDADVRVARPADDLTPPARRQAIRSGAFAQVAEPGNGFAVIAASADLFGIATELEADLDFAGAAGFSVVQTAAITGPLNTEVWSRQSWNNGLARQIPGPQAARRTAAGFAAVLPITDELEAIARESARFGPRYNAPFGTPIRPMDPTATVLPAPFFTESDLDRLLEAAGTADQR